MIEDKGISALDVIRLLEIVGKLAERLGGTATAVRYIEQRVLGDGGGEPPLAFADAATYARRVRRVRLKRNERLGAPLCRDPAWDMLLDLVASRAGEPVAISSLCFDAGVPPTTALRHVQHLAHAGLIARTADNSDHRRVLVDLTEAGVEKVTGIIAELQRCGVRPNAASGSG